MIAFYTQCSAACFFHLFNGGGSKCTRGPGSCFRSCGHRPLRVFSGSWQSERVNE